ncbi:MAG: UMP kinase, partial [Synergistaceae bacterium]|nr:UMP kinase [Synergistaceae bacterium]
PMKFKDAKFLPRLTYDEAISLNIEVLDTAAFAMCRENKIPIWVMSIQDPDWVKNIVEGADIGTIVRE